MAHRWDPLAPPVSGLVHPVRVDPAGAAGPTRAQARGRHWRQSSYGLFVPATVDAQVVEQRIVEAYARAGAASVVTAWAALRLLGGGHFDGLRRDGRSRRPVPIAANGSRLTSVDGIQVVRFTVPPDEVAVVQGVRCARSDRALFDEMRLQPTHREMAIAADSAFAGQLTSLSRMRRYVDTRRWYRDKRNVAASLDMAAEGSRSPQEGRFRHIWQYDAGWGQPLLNRAVLDLKGVQLGIPDLLDPVRGIVGEYAGADHRDIGQHSTDIRREAAFRAVGLEYVEVVARDLRDPQTVVNRLKEAQARAGVHPQTWVLGPAPPSLDSLLDAPDRRGAVE